MPTSFESFVNTELPLRTSVSPTPTAQNYGRFTGVGRAMEERTPIQVLADIAAAAAAHTHTESEITDLLHTAAGGPGTDTTAIHDDTSGEVSILTEKVTPVSADLLLIEDSASGNSKKKVQIGNLPSSGGSSLPVVDTTAIVKGSLDATKLLRFEADGLTTATTRVLTPLDKDYSIGDVLSDGSVPFTGTLHTDIIAETTTGLGVTIDGVLVKDSSIFGVYLNIQGTGSTTTPNGAVDSVLIYNAASGNNKKVLLNDLPGGDVLADGSVPFTGDVTLQNSSGSDGPELSLTRVDTSLGIGADVGRLNFRGWESGSPEAIVGQMRCEADAIWTASSSASKLVWGTTPTGSLSAVDVMSLSSSGVLKVNNNLLVGSGVTAKFGVDGDADEVQAIFRAHSTQTSNILEVQSSAGTVLAAFDGSGDLTVFKNITPKASNHLVFNCASGFVHNFKVNAASELNIKVDEMVFKNGATETSLKWPTNGQLDVAVGGVNVLEMSSSKIKGLQPIEATALRATGNLAGASGTVTFSNNYQVGGATLTGLTGRFAGKVGPAGNVGAYWLEVKVGTGTGWLAVYQ